MTTIRRCWRSLVVLLHDDDDDGLHHTACCIMTIVMNDDDYQEHHLEHVIRGPTPPAGDHRGKNEGGGKTLRLNIHRQRSHSAELSSSVTSSSFYPLNSE